MALYRRSRGLLGFLAAAFTLAACTGEPGVTAPAPEAAAAAAAAATYCGGSTAADLRLASGSSVGSVTVSNDGQTLYVTYTGSGEWLIGNERVMVARTLAEIPREDDGSADPWSFPYKADYDFANHSDTRSIALQTAGLKPGDQVILAVMAGVVHPVTPGKPTGAWEWLVAWGAGDRINPAHADATYFRYTVQSCGSTGTPTPTPTPTPAPAPSPGPTPGAGPELQLIAFGSCNKEYLSQPLWAPIVANKPNLWVWMGDAIYADTQDPATMAYKYQEQQSNSGYKTLLASVPIIGTWDDHDYGNDDIGKENPIKNEARQLFLDFIGAPKDSPRRTRQGIYESYVYGQPPHQVKIYLLDLRFNRDPIGSNGTMLGEEQWAWLANELRNSTAQINIIGSSTQFIPDQFPDEKWANFPSEKNRLLQLIADTKVPGVIILSGDRHFAEISRYTDPRIGYPLYEVTSSGMTHIDKNSWPNRYRLGSPLFALNFGQIAIDWSTSQVRLQVRDKSNKVQIEQVVNLAQLHS